MKPTPPSHIVLPVLTERLPSADALVDEVVETPFEVQPSAYAQAVYRSAEHAPLAEEAVAPWPSPEAIDQHWQQLIPVLREHIRVLVQAELDALAPQLSARLFDALEPTLKEALVSVLNKQDVV